MSRTPWNKYFWGDYTIDPPPERWFKMSGRVAQNDRADGSKSSVYTIGNVFQIHTQIIMDKMSLKGYNVIDPINWILFIIPMIFHRKVWQVKGKERLNFIGWKSYTSPLRLAESNFLLIFKALLRLTRTILHWLELTSNRSQNRMNSDYNGYRFNSI